MSNRRKLIAVFGITLFLVASIFAINVLSNEPWLSTEGISIHIVINNHTNEEIGPFVISGYRDSDPLRIDKIEPFSAADFYYEKLESWGENEIMMTDNYGKNYLVVPYFENGQRGRIDISIKCVTPDGLSGKRRELVSWYFSFVWRTWGEADCN